MLEYEYVYSNWFGDIREYKHFLQSLLRNVCGRNLFSCRHFETSSDLLLKTSLLFGYMSIANFLWRHKEHWFVIFPYGAAVLIIPTLILVFPFLLSLFSKYNWRDLYCSNSSRFEMIVCGYIFLLFKLTFDKASVL